MKFRIEQAVEILSKTPATLAALLGGLSPEWIGETGDREDWSPSDVVGHLIHAEATDWIPRAEIILAPAAERIFPPFDRFGQFAEPDAPPLEARLAEFADARRQSLERLRGWNLSAEQLARTGTHPELGRVTLEQLLATWVVHDLTHIRQIVAFLAKRYTAEVGPWREYLSILK